MSDKVLKDNIKVLIEQGFAVEKRKYHIYRCGDPKKPKSKVTYDVIHFNEKSNLDFGEDKTFPTSEEAATHFLQKVS